MLCARVEKNAVAASNGSVVTRAAGLGCAAIGKCSQLIDAGAAPDVERLIDPQRLPRADRVPLGNLADMHPVVTGDAIQRLPVPDGMIVDARAFPGLR